MNFLQYLALGATWVISIGSLCFSTYKDNIKNKTAVVFCIATAISILLYAQIELAHFTHQKSIEKEKREQLVLLKVNDIKEHNKVIETIMEEQRSSLKDFNNLLIEKEESIAQINRLADEQMNSIANIYNLFAAQDSILNSVFSISHGTFRNTEEFKQELEKIIVNSSSDRSMTNDLLSRLNAKESTLKEVSETGNTSNKRLKTTVEYYSKNTDKFDKDKLKKDIENLGFGKVEIKNSRNSNQTDTIWFGDDVDIEDVKLLASTLIQTGIRLKSIRSFDPREQRNSAPNLVWIGALKNRDELKSCPTWTVESINVTNRGETSEAVTRGNLA